MEPTHDDDSIADLVDIVSADFPQARVDQLDRLCELVRTALPELGSPACPLALTHRLADGARALATQPASVQPALLARELEEGDATVGAPAAAPSISGIAVAAELALLLHVHTLERLVGMGGSQERVARALRHYAHPLALGAAKDAAVEVMVDETPLDDTERMAAVLDDDDDDSAYAEPFHMASAAADGGAAALRDGARAAAAELSADDQNWPAVLAKLGALNAHLSHAALAGLPAERWLGDEGVGARACAMLERILARAHALAVAPQSLAPSALDGLSAHAWSQLLIERMLHAPPSTAALLPRLLAAVGAPPDGGAEDEPAARACVHNRLSVCAVLQADEQWARALGTARPTVNALLRAQLADLATELHALASAAAAPSAPARAAAARIAPSQLVSYASTALSYWAERTPQPSRADQAACAEALLESGLWAAASRLLTLPRRAQPAAAPPWDEQGLWSVALACACRHAELAQFASMAPQLHAAATARTPAEGGVSWAWVFAAAERARAASAAADRAGALEAAAAAQLGALAEAATRALAGAPLADAAAPGAGVAAPEHSVAALARTLESLELLCAAPHGAHLSPAGSGALGGTLARAHAATHAGLASWHAQPLGAAGEAVDGATAGAGADARAPGGAEDEARAKAMRGLSQIQLRIKAVRCAAAGGKRD